MSTTAMQLPAQDQLVPIRSQFESVSALASPWLARARQRRHLAELTGSQLDDVGLSMKAALAEAEKPFWRA